MSRLLALFLSVALLLSGCASQPQETNPSASSETTAENIEDGTSESSIASEAKLVEIPEEEKGDDTDFIYKPEFESLNDEELLDYVKDNVYQEIVSELDSSEYFIENVDAVYISQDYLEEAAYNSKSNIFFGYTLEEVEKIYPDTQYVFTIGNDGRTIVKPFEDYDDTYEKVIKNVAIGTGVILVCVTVSVVTGGAGASAISMIFAASAKTGTVMALSSGTISAAASGIVTGIKTGDMEQAMKAAALSGSEAFKWGAISGAAIGGASQAIALKGATLNGLSMNEAAAIQKESGYPLDVIKQFHTKEEYEVFKQAGLSSKLVNGKLALVRNNIDLNAVDDFGRSNLERMAKGLSPLDQNGLPYELHHIGQNADGSLAILTQAEHDNAALHGFKMVSEINRPEFAKQRAMFWKTMAKMLAEGGI